MSLRAILSGSRVKKRTAPSAAANKKKTAAAARASAADPSSARSTSRSASSTPPWPGGLRQTKPGNGRGSTAKNAKAAQHAAAEEDGGGGDDDTAAAAGEGDELFDEDEDAYKLDDSGLVASLADDLSLRDVVQALRYARAGMFDPLPEQRAHALANASASAGSDEADGSSTATANPRVGFVGNSTRVAELLNMRRRLPPLATTAHVAALLPNATATERETVTLVRAGQLRKVVQPQWRRGAGVEHHPGGGGPDRGGGGKSGSDGHGNSSSSSSNRGGGDSGRLRRALAIGGESLGEVLIETAALQQLVREARTLSDDTKAAFSAWLQGDRSANEAAAATAQPPESGKLFTINDWPAPQLTSVRMVDELVRAGFLVGHGAAASSLGSVNVLGGHRSSGRSSVAGGSAHGRGDRGSQSDTGDVFARPEDRTTLLSLETVAKAASGSYEAVGGLGAVYTAGGGGARAGVKKGRAGAAAAGGASASTTTTTTEDLLLAIPGHGAFIKLVSGALAYLVGILARTPYRETLESSLRERWDAGGGFASGSGGVRASQRGFKRVPLSRTKKWKDFYGLSFDWVLAEALGAGLVELFDTGSVGRGVRLLA